MKKIVSCMSKINKFLNTLNPKKTTPFDAFKTELETQLLFSKKDNLPKRKRAFLGAGSQSVALEDGHKKILLVVPLSAAKGIELFIKTFSTLSLAKQRDLPFELPTLVGINQPLHELMNLASDKSLTHAKGTYLANIQSKIITGSENVVYQLTRCDGSLEDFREKTRFKSNSIDEIQKQISTALTILHNQKLAHGDVALRNIFYTGTYPNFKFYLGDFGSVKPLSADKKNHPEMAKDKENLNYAIKQLQEKLKRCPASPEKTKEHLIQFRAKNEISSTTVLSTFSRTKLSF